MTLGLAVVAAIIAKLTGFWGFGDYALESRLQRQYEAMETR